MACNRLLPLITTTITISILHNFVIGGVIVTFILMTDSTGLQMKMKCKLKMLLNNLITAKEKIILRKRLLHSFRMMSDSPYYMYIYNRFCEVSSITKKLTEEFYMVSSITKKNLFLLKLLVSESIWQHFLPTRDLCDLMAHLVCIGNGEGIH